MHTYQSAICLIEERFPSLAEELHNEIIEGLLHPQMGEFARFAQEAIDTGDKDTWEKITTAFLELWSNCDDSVRNALNVSFLEHLNFEDRRRQRQWAYQLMPRAMRSAWEEMESYNRRLHGG
ncbi:MAG: hypothetical protein ABL919_06000 [Methylococcales bacterium]|nr:hypothetical protein [Methylococcaceae bacterium]